MNFRRFTKYLPIALLVAVFFSNMYSQDAKLMKSIVDSKTGITFNNFRTDSTETVFYEVKLDNSLVYDTPKSNSDLVYSLDVNSMVEYIELGPKKNYVKIRIVDTVTNVVEGWIRKKDISKRKYYGRSFLSFTKEASDQNKIENTLIDPRWVKQPDQKIFLDETLTGPVVSILGKGELVFIDSLLEKTARIKHRNDDGSYISGFINIDTLSPLAMIDSARTDFDELFKKIDPLVFKYNLKQSGFVSYSGILVSGVLKKGINEDKVCREIGTDSLMYKFTFTDDIKDVVKKFENKLSPSKHNFAMYRQSPNEKIITRADTIDCQVIEIVHTPKSASISLNSIEETEITNKISKFYIHHIEKFDMYIVFHKETNEYLWSYKKNTGTGKYIENKYKPTKIIQRVVAFRKYDLDK